MSEKERIPLLPKQQPRQTPAEKPKGITEKSLPSVDETPVMPPVKPPKED